MIWFAFLVLVVVALALLLRPLSRSALPVSDARSSELAVYRDQLKEIDADLGRGLISGTEAEAARIEIKRKMLSVAPSPAATRDPQTAARRAMMVVGAGVPVLGLVIYLIVGQPNLPGQVFVKQNAAASEDVAAAVTPSEPLADVDTLVTRLAERLKQNPDDPQGWRMLGWSYFHLERFADASKAFERAIALDGKNAELRSQYGESVVRAAGGLVTPEAEKIFDAALAIDPSEPRAQFFRGLALDQHGKSKEALSLWVKILREGKADAEWVPALRERATELAVKLKMDPAKEVPGASAAPSASVAAQPEERIEPNDASGHGDPAEIVEALSKRLETAPKDYEGWILLARSYRALGKNELALASLARAKEIFAGAPFVLQQIETARAELANPDIAQPGAKAARGPSADDVAAVSQLAPDEQNAMIVGMVTKLEERLRQSPNDLDGWLMLARSRKVLGDANAARTAIGRAEELFRGDAAARARISEVAAELGLN